MSSADSKQVEVTRTYLEMRERSALNPAYSDDPRLRLDRVEDCPISFFRYLYREVGRDYHWVDRLSLTDEEIAAYLADPGVSVWLLTCAGAPAGYFELKHDTSDGSVEIAYFGLLPEFLRRGYGKHLLTRAVEDQKWMTDEQFTRDWALCQICPGINLLAIAILIGRRVLGGRGVALALLGLLLPSISITVAISAWFRLAYGSQTLQAAVQAVIPATVGLGWLTCMQLGRGTLSAARQQGTRDAAFAAATIILAGTIFAILRPSPILLLLGFGSLGALYRLADRRRRSGAGEA